MTKTDFEKQTEELARQLQYAIDHWDDPDQVAARAEYEAEKADRQRAIFERLYLETGQRQPGETLEASVAKMARFFSDEIEGGKPLPATQPLPPLDNGPDLSLRMSAHNEENEHVLELNVEGRGSEVLVTGHLQRVLVFLRARQAAYFIVLTAKKLAGVIR